MILIPIRTECPIHRTPAGNYALIALNVAAYLLLNVPAGPELAQFKDRHLTFHSSSPSLVQFVTYQFVHADLVHLLGNMLFLWVFGNAVNAKMRDAAYVMFYLAGGVLAASWFAAGSSADLVGASGSIAAVTSAYLMLFPRSRITVLYILFFIGQFQMPAMFMIGLKIILWDNVVGPALSGGSGQVATEAHLAGYLFGAVFTGGLLWMRGLPRDHFDMPALVKRWNQRRQYRAIMADPQARAEAEYGRVARPVPASPAALMADAARLDRTSELRTRIGDRLGAGDVSGALSSHQELIGVDPDVCLSLRTQIVIAREYFRAGRFPQAAAAFGQYLKCYGGAPGAQEVQLLLGIIYARDLHRYEEALRHLSAALPKLTDPAHREQCEAWLAQVRAALAPGGQ